MIHMKRVPYHRVQALRTHTRFLAIVLLLLLLLPSSAVHLTSVQQKSRSTAIVHVTLVSPAAGVAARAGESSTISWEFLPGHTAVPGDFIAAFAPSGADGAPSVSTVTARQCLSAACRDSRPVPLPLTPTGSLDFVQLVHSRTNYTFLYFSPQRCTGCWDTPALAFSRTLQFKDGNEPVGVHLSVTGRAGEAVVSFSTRSGEPAVKFGPSDGAINNTLPHFAVGMSTTYVADDLCGAPANDSASGDFIPPHSLNAVTLSGLHAHQKIDYQAGTVNGSYGKRWTFTMPAIGADANTNNDDEIRNRKARIDIKPFRMAIFGDMGQDLSYNDRVGSQPAATATLFSIRRQDPDMVLHIGDISYARGSGSLWPAFFQQIESVAATRPYLTGIGNHEYDYNEQAFNWTRGSDSGGECGVPYDKHFSNPSSSRFQGATAKTKANTKAKAEAVHWWSLDLKLVHLIMLSSEDDWTNGSIQHAWLERDLSAVNRTKTPFVVLATHRPFYSSGYGWLTADPYSVSYMAAQRAAIEPLLGAFQVDLAIVGHVHKYERTCRMVAAGRCARLGEHGTVHLVLGAAGEPFQTGCDGCSAWEHVAVVEGRGMQRRAGGSARQFAAPAWSKFRTTAFGYGVMTVHNASALQVEFITPKDGDTVHDSVWILK